MYLSAHEAKHGGHSTLPPAGSVVYLRLVLVLVLVLVLLLLVLLLRVRLPSRLPAPSLIFVGGRRQEGAPRVPRSKKQRPAAAARKY